MPTWKKKIRFSDDDDDDGSDIDDNNIKAL